MFDGVSTGILIGMAVSSAVSAFAAGYAIGALREARRIAKWIVRESSGESVFALHARVNVLDTIVDEVSDKLAATIRRVAALEGKSENATQE